MITRAGFGVREPVGIRATGGDDREAGSRRSQLVTSVWNLSSLFRRCLAVELTVSASVPKVDEGGINSDISA